MEVRYLAHAKQMQALDLIPAWAAQFQRAFGRVAGGLVHPYAIEDADTVVVALGSVLGTIKDTVDEMRAQGVRIGVLGVTCFRPWPLAAVGAMLAGAKRVVVLEKSLAVGVGGIVSANVRTSLIGRAIPVYDVVAGLGGRAITKASLARVFASAMSDELGLTTFLDLDRRVVERVLLKESETRRSGPLAENVLRESHGLPAR